MERYFPCEDSVSGSERWIIERGLIASKNTQFRAKGIEIRKMLKSSGKLETVKNILKSSSPRDAFDENKTSLFNHLILLEEFSLYSEEFISDGLYSSLQNRKIEKQLDTKKAMKLRCK